VEYDRSEISEERLAKYMNAEVGAGVTLVGPHRDDVKFQISNVKYPMSNEENVYLDAKEFASRGQQRLIVLELKLFQVGFLAARLEQRPVLLLDDIFSELDGGHISRVLELVGRQQTVITTTHEEFVRGSGVEVRKVIEVGKVS
jgi:DNA replication and repair protein RecF